LKPQPIPLSSGNLIAERRFEWARDLEANGELAGAADLLVQALELAPDYAAAWFALGALREKQGNYDGAIAAFRKAAQADCADRFGARLHLIRLGAEPMVGMPAAYMRALFDGYAGVFDQALTQGLGYCAPELLLRAVEAARAGERLKFGCVLDLGCGTGLAGAVFRPFCDWLVGVDLSPAMLAQARAKGLYDRLIEGDLSSILAAEAAAQARYHLMLAADVFVYLPDLAPILAAAAAVLVPAGLIAFSVETHDDDGVILRETLRYAQGAAHVRAALASACLKLISLDSAAARAEKGQAAPGLIVVAGSA
jgi:predicted TPR repeat methyltransferase